MHSTSHPLEKSSETQQFTRPSQMLDLSVLDHVLRALPPFRTREVDDGALQTLENPTTKPRFRRVQHR